MKKLISFCFLMTISVLLSGNIFAQAEVDADLVAALQYANEPIAAVVTFYGDDTPTSAQIDLLNQEIEDCRFFYGKTFDSGLSEENYKVVVDNTRMKYQLIESAARRIADKISNLVSKY